MSSKEQIIKTLNLLPHPEGGYYRETYRSDGVIGNENLDASFEGTRNYSTCIYFLLTSESFSAFHKINQDEGWHFYKGSPIDLHIITKEGEHKHISIGSAIEEGQVPQYIVKAGDYFAAQVSEPDSYALVGCTVAPGFDFRDFKMPPAEELIDLFPVHASLIQKFSRH